MDGQAAAGGAQAGRAARVRRLEGPVRLRRAAASAHPRSASGLPRGDDARLTAPVPATRIPGTGADRLTAVAPAPPVKRPSRALSRPRSPCWCCCWSRPRRSCCSLRDDGGAVTTCGSRGSPPTSPCSATPSGSPAAATTASSRSRPAGRTARTPHHRLLAAAGRGRRRLGVDRQRGRRQRHPAEPARPGVTRAGGSASARRHRRRRRPDGAWVTNGQAGTVTRIDSVSNRVLGSPIRTGEFPTALAIGANHVWVVNSGDGTVARVDPREHVVVGRRLPVGRDPQDIAVGFGSVWVANRGDGTLTRLSAVDGRAQGPSIRVGGAPARWRSRATPCWCWTPRAARSYAWTRRRSPPPACCGSRLPCVARRRGGRGLGRGRPAGHGHTHHRLIRSNSRPAGFRVVGLVTYASSEGSGSGTDGVWKGRDGRGRGRARARRRRCDRARGQAAPCTPQPPGGLVCPRGQDRSSGGAGRRQPGVRLQRIRARWT